MENLNQIKKTFINQSLNVFKALYENKEINKYFTSFYYTLSKKFITLQPVYSIDLTVKYTNKYYSQLMNFDEDFYNSLNVDDIFKDMNNDDDKYYKDWFDKIKSVWFDIDFEERKHIIQLIQCMVMTASKYFIIVNNS